MLERQREGKYKGRTPTARRQSAKILALAQSGWSRPRIASELGISERSIYRVLASALGPSVTERRP
jgi:DNA invertase Pin-like site-specific DNA recombinase